MDDFHHNHYFRDIGYNKDGNFHWSGEEWKQVQKGEYEGGVRTRIEGAEELQSLSQLDSESDKTFVVYVDIRLGMQSQPFKRIGFYFQIWHEIERGDYRGLHQFWWHNNNYIVIVNLAEELGGKLKELRKGKMWQPGEFPEVKE